MQPVCVHKSNSTIGTPGPLTNPRADLFSRSLQQSFSGGHGSLLFGGDGDSFREFGRSFGPERQSPRNLYVAFVVWLRKNRERLDSGVLPNWSRGCLPTIILVLKNKEEGT